MPKRYAIVRVDGRYEPSHFEVNSIENISELKILDEVVKEYGDTKEQLVRKVATALQICNKNRVEKCNQFYFVAKKIVEFLGVEDERKI